MMARGASAPARFGRAHAVILGLVVAAGVLAVLFPWFPGTPRLDEGTVAPFTLTAPRDLSFESAVLTEQVRDEVAAAVEERVRFDSELGARQLAELARQLDAINAARGDADLSASARESAVRAVPSVTLSASSAAVFATATDGQWAAYAAEAEETLARTLSGAVSADGLAAARERARELLSPLLAPEQARALTQLIEPLVVPTLVVDEEESERLRAEARAGQPPVRVTRARGEVLVASGEIIDAATVELLERAQFRRDSLRLADVAAAVLLAGLAGAAVGGYLLIAQPAVLSGVRRMTLFVLLLLIPLAIEKFTLAIVLPDIDRHFIAYALPVAAAPMAAAVLLDVALALLLVTLLAAVAGVVSISVPLADAGGGAQLETARLWLTISAASIGGVYVVARAQRLNRYLVAGAAASGGAGVALLAVWLVDADREVADLFWMAGAASVSGLLAALIAVGVFVLLSRPFGIITRFELMELSQLSHPLLQRLQDEAPGTFQHSMLVGTLAERAASRIGADALLVRIGAYYHDVGKLVAPPFFVENAPDEANPHEALDALQSTRVIHQHVSGGVELARRAGLPEAVVQFIPQHHGTRLTAFFYRRAAEADPDIDPALFRYPGPKPQSRETALVMLADSGEATVRSSSDRSGERIREIVEEIVRERIDEGQFDECDLSLRDLRETVEAFVATLSAVYHPRVEYPDPSDRELAERKRVPLPEREHPDAVEASIQPGRARPAEAGRPAQLPPPAIEADGADGTADGAELNEDRA